LGPVKCFAGLFEGKEKDFEVQALAAPVPPPRLNPGSSPGQA